jgi:hypothetical protein
MFFFVILLLVLVVLVDQRDVLGFFFLGGRDIGGIFGLGFLVNESIVLNPVKTLAAGA